MTVYPNWVIDILDRKFGFMHTIAAVA